MSFKWLRSGAVRGAHRPRDLKVKFEMAAHYRYRFGMFAYLCVAVGGALGSLGRFWLSGWVAERYGMVFPWGTLVINITGSFLIGMFYALYEPGGHMEASPTFRQFFMIGICGGYTTFSSFSLETLLQMKSGNWLYAGSYVLSSVLLCLIAVWLGYVLGGLLNSLKGH